MELTQDLENSKTLSFAGSGLFRPKMLLPPLPLSKLVDGEKDSERAKEIRSNGQVGTLGGKDCVE